MLHAGVSLEGGDEVTISNKNAQQFYWGRRFLSDPNSALDDIVEMRDLCVLLTDALDNPWKNDEQLRASLVAKAREVLKRTDPEDKP